MLALCVGTYANDTDVSVDRPAEIPTEITYTPYNTICSLLVPVIRGVFFRVAPPIYRTDDPPNNEKSLGTFPVAASVHVRRASSQTRPFISPRECSGEAWSPTLSSVPVKRASSHTRPFSSRGNAAEMLATQHDHSQRISLLGPTTPRYCRRMGGAILAQVRITNKSS